MLAVMVALEDEQNEMPSGLYLPLGNTLNEESHKRLQLGTGLRRIPEGLPSTKIQSAPITSEVTFC
jgi:hypothetical protein